MLKEAKNTGLIFMQVLISVFYINPADYSLLTNISKHAVQYCCETLPPGGDSFSYTLLKTSHMQESASALTQTSLSFQLSFSFR